MTTLYNCRHDGDQYRITKFDDSMNVESSYLCTLEECECPGWPRRNACRHTEMLPKFIEHGNVGTGWMFDYNRSGWVHMTFDEPQPSVEFIPDRTASPTNFRRRV